MSFRGAPLGAMEHGGYQPLQQVSQQHQQTLVQETEGWWGVLLTLVVVSAAIGTGAFVGVGTWRVVHDIAPLADVKAESIALRANVTDLLEDAQLIIPPDNCTVFVGNQTQPDEFPSDEFFIYSGGDSALQVDFNTSALNSGATVFVQLQNTSGVLAYTEDVAQDIATFVASVFTIFNAAEATKEVQFDLDAIANGTTVVLAPPDGDCTIAYLADIPAQIVEFADDEYVLQTWQSGDDTTATFDASAITSGATRVLTVPDKDGTVAYLGNVAALGATMLDGTLRIYHAAQPSSKTRFDLGDLTAPSTRTLAFQDRSGTIALLEEVPDITFTEVDITASGTFPDVGREGFVTFQEGKIIQVEITMCGGGGAGVGGCASNGSGNARFQVGGGGAGGAIQGFVLRDVSEFYERFDITIGERGVATAGPTVEENHITFTGGQGGDTIVEAQRLTPLVDPVTLVAYGGQRGLGATGTAPTATYYGGCSAGSAGQTPLDPTDIEPAPGGEFGGVPGVCGDAVGHDPVRGSLRYPWLAGGHGSERRALIEGGNPPVYYVCEEENTCGSSNMVNGGEGGHPASSSTAWVAGGGGGLFGAGGTPAAPDAGLNTCAGGGVLNVGQPFPDCLSETHRTGRGGSGRVTIRYWQEV